MRERAVPGLRGKTSASSAKSDGREVPAGIVDIHAAADSPPNR